MNFGFGPASEMNKTVQRLKRNKQNTLKKIGQLDHRTNYKLTNKKASQKQLDEIKVRIQKENRESSIKKIVFFFIFLGVLVYMIYL